MAVALAFAAHASHGALVAAAPAAVTTAEETLPSIRALGVLALGYRSLAADYYWFRALSYFGDRRMNARNYPLLAPLVQRLLALDPFFVTGYYFAGTALTLEGMDARVSTELLEQGMRYRSDDWRIPFLLGFNSYYFEHDYGRGARALAIAAKHPEAPEFTGPLATRLAAEGGVPEVGIALVDSLIDGATDPKVRELYLERRRLLELEIVLRYLDEAIARHVERTGARPRALRDLLSAGLLLEIPAEPLGGRFFIGPDGRARTTNHEQRLRLKETAVRP